MRNLVSAIIYRALLDWNTHREGVRSFFMSEWGEHLCSIIGLPAKKILRRLEEGKIKMKLEEEEL